MNGRGTYQYSDGSVYEGSWVDSKMHGKGVYAYPNHDRYEGEFADDMKQVRRSACVSVFLLVDRIIHGGLVGRTHARFFRAGGLAS